jgi:hypothetical protein
MMVQALYYWLQVVDFAPLLTPLVQYLQHEVLQYRFIQGMIISYLCLYIPGFYIINHKKKPALLDRFT